MSTTMLSNPVFSTSSYRHHTAEEFRLLAEWGFTHVLSAVSNLPSKREVDLGHEYGLTMIARWPDWAHLKCLGEDMAFRNYLGASNTGHSLYSGPSWWCQEADRRALDDLPRIIEDGWDGVLCHIITGDRPGPTGWHLSSHREWKEVYWSFDEWAREAYGTLRRPIPMPARPDPHGDLEFYRWYQDAWLSRLETFTGAALEYVKNVWAWFIPMDWFEPETMADGTADSTPAISQWRQNVLNAGADPLVVVSHMFGMGSAWQPKAERTMQEQNEAGWRSIVGAECNPGVAPRNLLANGREARNLGFSGLLCGDEELLKQPAAVMPFSAWW
jgi:hypothetical protein